MDIYRARQAGRGIRTGKWLDGWRIPSRRRDAERLLRRCGTSSSLILALAAAAVGEWGAFAAFAAFAVVAFVPMLVMLLVMAWVQRRCEP